MEHPSPLPYLQEALLFLAIAGFVVPLLQRLRLNAVICFLALGMLVGPHGLGRWAENVTWLQHVTLEDAVGAQQLSELGVVLLLFLIGMELSLERLWSLRKWVLGAGILQVVLSATLIGGIALLYGNSASSAVILGMGFALSSTAVVMQLLLQARRLATPLGQSVFSVLLMQDLFVVPIILLVNILSQASTESIFLTVCYAFLKAVLVISVLFIAGRWVLRPAFAVISNLRQSDAFMALTLFGIIGVATLTWSAGLSMALGAFLAGLLVAETEYKHEIEIIIEPFKGLLMGLFFLAVGMNIDIAALFHHPLQIAYAVIGLFAIKSGIVAGLFKLLGLRTVEAMEAGLLLGQGGEFAFVVITLALGGQLIDQPTAQFMFLVVAIGILITPPVAFIARQMALTLHSKTESVESIVAHPHFNEHVILAGFGRVGEIIGKVMDELSVPYVAVDKNAAQVSKWREMGIPIYFGDASRHELMEKLNIGKAKAIVITMDNPQAVEGALVAIRKYYPALPIVARAHNEASAARLMQAGATLVVPETLEAALQMAGDVLTQLGFSEEGSSAVISRFRQRELSMHRGATL